MGNDDCDAIYQRFAALWHDKIECELGDSFEVRIGLGQSLMKEVALVWGGSSDNGGQLHR